MEMGNGLYCFGTGPSRRGSLREMRISPTVTLETPDEPTASSVLETDNITQRVLE
jgi:hypothetical protein